MTTPVESNVFSPDSVSRQRRRALWVAASVAAVVLFALVGWMAGSNRQGKAPGARVQQPVQENPRCSDLSLPTALTPNRAEAVPLAITPVAQDEPRLTSGGVGPLSLPDVDCESVEEILRESVLLIFVGVDDGKKSHAWPFATCSAIGESTLLTSAREILQLAAWRRQGHRMWVSRSVDGPRFAIKDFRVHHEFAALAGTPADWMYANLGLLVTEEKLPRPVRMASQKELQELEEGLPVACFGFSHGGEKLTRFHHLQVRWYRGEVYLLSDAVQENRPPRLLELKAEFPENMYGSPVVNDRGRVVGVYGETAPAQALGVENLHYATVLDVPLLQSWLAGSEQGWVSPPLGAIRVDKTESSSP